MSSKLIYLVNPNQHTRYPQPPLNLLQIASVLESHRHYVKLIDANALNLNAAELPALVEDADVIGLTAMTPTISEASSIAKAIKRAYPDKLIVLGGVHAALLPVETQNYGPFDVIVAGEGEIACEDISEWDGARRIIYPSLVNNLDSLPMPAYHLLDWKLYHPHPPHGRRSPHVPMITSRGCPYNCTFCSKPPQSHRYRAQSIPRVTSEIAYLKERHGVREITFYDDTFTLNHNRACQLSNALRDFKVDWTCETRVNLVTPELLMLMKQAGCYRISYGIESGNQCTLDKLRKDITLEQVEQAVRWTHEAGIQTCGYFMLECPGETPEMMQKSISFACSLSLDYAQFAVTVPLPGSQLYETNGNKGKSWSEYSYLKFGNGAPVLSQANKQFYLRPGYIWKRFKMSVSSWPEFRMTLKGLKMFMEQMNARS